MKITPMIFNDPMVRALMQGRKTQTRRPAKAKHIPFFEKILRNFLDGKWDQRPMPYKPGDLIYVRETWAGPVLDVNDRGNVLEVILYRATDEQATNHRGEKIGWRPSIHMPRWASRITLEITDVRVERVQEISEEDSRAERCGPYRLHFRQSWHSLYAARGLGWDANPWVWALSFRVHRMNVDEFLKNNGKQ